MHRRQCLIACLAIVLATFSSVKGYSEGKCEAAEDESGKRWCLDCMHLVKCPVFEDGTADPTEDTMCSIGEACEMQAEYPTCVPIASDSSCSCEVPAQCDFYNPDEVLNCADGNPIFVESCPVGQACTGTMCEAVTTQTPPSEYCQVGGTDKPDGWNLIPDDCTSAVYCHTGVSQGTYHCLDTEYFDTKLHMCVPAPPVACGDSDYGAKENLGDCTQYYICDQGNILLTVDCEKGKLYDPAVEACVTEADITTELRCKELETCGFPPAGIRDQRFPHIQSIEIQKQLASILLKQIADRQKLEAQEGKH